MYESETMFQPLVESGIHLIVPFAEKNMSCSKKRISTDGLVVNSAFDNANHTFPTTVHDDKVLADAKVHQILICRKILSGLSENLCQKVFMIAW